jgi:Tetracyclin repressor-like, C-terminal domain
VIPNLLALRTADPKLGVQRGELPADADFGLLADLLHGPLYYRLLVSGAAIGRGQAEEIADAVLPLRRPAGA